ncbi:hypothetical protein SAMD00019534_103440 [Acytostelium subglobosum LB1]|uniref:hypothetical protein n=1 Tax=Acytostelium subglobosum LB1 TaxID=1410327 RepID=UPI0006447FE4|nr:hypothetical protein SAMD00019534_103440 [Acytostelium subglobosum LB1]GAM27169.1 hypothetical protein SAMD00019534_103440 [Acytostelium subglobosum LB1]|eukprot:XP_012750049.1 hypothetical protein SAMD00019534_103440 [Acytostelium subglobosum LB1]
MVSTMNSSSSADSSQPSAFQVAAVKLTLSLAPANIGNIIGGARSALDRLIFRYNTTLKATIISYSNLRLVQHNIPNFYDSPFLSVPITVNMMVFRPMNGQLMHGVVKRVSSTHLSLLVFGVVSASISKADLPKGLYYDHSSNTFVDKSAADGDSSSLISLGTKILFRVKDVLTDKNYITINGQMTDSDTYITGHEEIKVETPKKNQQQQRADAKKKTPNKNLFQDLKAEKVDDDEEMEEAEVKVEKKQAEKDESSDDSDSISSDSLSSDESDDESDKDKKNKKSKTNDKAPVKKTPTKKDESSESESSESESEDSDDEAAKKKKNKKSSNGDSKKNNNKDDKKDDKKKTSTKKKAESSESESSESSESESDAKKSKKRKSVDEDKSDKVKKSKK